MAITGEYIHEFHYIDYNTNNPPKILKDYLLIKLEDVESKHVADERKETEHFFELSNKVGYSNTILGIHRNSSIKNEYLRIQNMAHSTCKRAVRFVISKDNKIWSDNTHWTLAYILDKGATTTISDIPAYIVDFRASCPVVYDKEGVVFDSIFDIKSAIASAKRIQDRLDFGWRPLEMSYPIKQLYQDILSVISKEIQ